MLFTKFTALLTVLAAAAVQATPIDLSLQPIIQPIIDDVYSPDITSPKVGDLWTVGQNQTVTWDASKVPQTNENSTGLLLLGYEDDPSAGEHLDIKDPLAVGFPISAGTVSFTVPNVTDRSDYIVVLFGDSGNASPKFTIST
ncbi:hypothetical protein B0H21DRAFT_687892 [Amylocystis lapponica]|nr:hypothetical protein B0H21DRAFT_687892 [Amylocystis lapponica]